MKGFFLYGILSLHLQFTQICLMSQNGILLHFRKNWY